MSSLLSFGIKYTFSAAAVRVKSHFCGLYRNNERLCRWSRQHDLMPETSIDTSCRFFDFRFFSIPHLFLVNNSFSRSSQRPSWLLSAVGCYLLVSRCSCVSVWLCHKLYSLHLDQLSASKQQWKSVRNRQNGFSICVQYSILKSSVFCFVFYKRRSVRMAVKRVFIYTTQSMRRRNTVTKYGRLRKNKSGLQMGWKVGNKKYFQCWGSPHERCSTRYPFRLADGRRKWLNKSFRRKTEHKSGINNQNYYFNIAGYYQLNFGNAKCRRTFGTASERASILDILFFILRQIGRVKENHKTFHAQRRKLIIISNMAAGNFILYGM